MNDLESVRNRMKKRNNHYQPLNDHNFNIIYRIMIRFMVIILVIIASMIVVKDQNLYTNILNNQLLKDTSSWLSLQVLSYLPEDKTVSTSSLYHHIKDNRFTSDSNEVINLEKGRVVAIGKDDTLGNYITILSKDLMITYGKLTKTNVKEYQNIKEKASIGTYDKELIINFEYLGKAITYEEYQRDE